MRGLKKALRGGALLAGAVIVLVTAGPVHAQGSRKDDIVLNSRGLPLAGATVRVCTSAGAGQPCSPLALIYSDAALTQALANPITTDGMGNYTFYAVPGKYLIEISGPGITTRQMPDVILPSDPTAPSFSSISSAGAISAFSLSLGGNLSVGGSATVSGAANLNGGGSMTGTFTGSPTLSGNPSFAGLPTFSAASVVSQKPASGDAIRYVSTSGSDSNDGLSWGTAKLTVYGALISLPGGSASPATAGAGTVYVANGASSNPTSGAGIWLMASTDPNYAAPPSGWLRFSGALNITGSTATNDGPNAHLPRTAIAAGSSADRNHPGIWISGVQGPLHLSNLSVKYPGRGVVVGECSTNTRTGTCAVSNVTFDNVTAQLNSAAGNGPTWDITGGSFWLYFNDCGGSGLEYLNGISDDKSSAFLFDGAGNNGPGLIFMRNINTTNGGIKCIPGATGGCSGIINGMIREGIGGAGMPAVWVTSAGAAKYGPLELFNIQVADTGATTPAVQNDKPLGGYISAFGVYGAGKDIIGPVTVMDRYSGIDSNSPYLQSATGFSQGRVIGQIDVARRGFAPTAVRFANQALQGSNITCSNFGGGVTRTTGVTGPDGAANAVTCTTVTGGNEEIFVNPNGAGQWSQTVAVGDWLFVGWWSKSSGTVQDINGILSLATGGFTCVPYGTSVTGGAYGSAVNQMYLWPYIYGDGEWHWKGGACKIAAIGTNPLLIQAGQIFNSGQGMTIYAPVMFRVPTGTISDGEAMEVLYSLSSNPTGAAAGDIAMLPGQRLNLTGNSITNIGSSGTTLSRYARYAVTLSPVAVAANTCAAQSFTVTGLQAGDILIAVNKPAEQAGLSVTPGHVSAANTATLNFCNHTAGSITPTASESYSFVAVQ